MTITEMMKRQLAARVAFEQAVRTAQDADRRVRETAEALDDLMREALEIEMPGRPKKVERG